MTAIGGVNAAPKRAPECVTPCAKPRSLAGSQNESARVAVGNAPASPIPKRNRTTYIDHLPRASAVMAVKADHQRAIAANIRRGPNRSPSQPPGIRKSAYDKLNPLKIQPSVTLSKP